MMWYILVPKQSPSKNHRFYPNLWSRVLPSTVIVPYINEEGINKMARHLQDEKIDPQLYTSTDEIVSIYHIPEIKFTEKILQCSL